MPFSFIYEDHLGELVVHGVCMGHEQGHSGRSRNEDEVFAPDRLGMQGCKVVKEFLLRGLVGSSMRSILCFFMTLPPLL